MLENEESITFDEAMELTELPRHDLPDLISLAGKVTLKHAGEGVYLCSIISAQTGNCLEDCSFCTQSAHYNTDVASHAFINIGSIIRAARQAERNGASNFCIVISAKSPSNAVFKKVVAAVDLIRDQTNLAVDCSLGMLSEKQAFTLKGHGVRIYNHNIEACRSFFPNVVTTHTYEDRVATAKLVKKAGMELCCGGIVGMGESARQRMELAFELKELDPDRIPINFLNPRPGTPFENVEPIKPYEAVKTIAIFRLIHPDKALIAAGGREVVLKDLQSVGLQAGANAMIIGNYLTTPGRSAEADLKMLDDLGMQVKKDN